MEVIRTARARARAGGWERGTGNALWGVIAHGTGDMEVACQAVLGAVEAERAERAERIEGAGMNAGGRR